MNPKEEKLEPKSEIEELLFLLQRNRIPVSIPDTAIVRNGVLRGLFYCADRDGDGVVTFDPEWPVVDYDSQQTRMYSTKRASEAAAKVEVAVSFFSKDSVTIDAPIVFHLSVPFGHVRSANDNGRHSVEVNCQFFTKARFVELLRTNKIRDGLLCRYVQPETRKHNMVRVLFTPFAINVEKHQSQAEIDDPTLPMIERVSVSKGNGGKYDVLPVSSAVEDYARRFSSQLFEFFKCNGAVLDRAVFFFTETKTDRLQFLWAGLIELKPWFLEPDFACFDASASIDAPLDGQPEQSTAERSASTGGRLSILAGRVEASAASGLSHSPHGSTLTRGAPTHARLLTPSPVPVSLQVDAASELMAEVKDFGFYSDEPQRIKESLKRQIRSISRVELPHALELDDTPPYDEAFIAALCDPEKAAAYFFPKANGGLGRHRKSFGITRSRSRIFSFVDTDVNDVEQRASKLDKSMGSFRRVRSGSTGSATGGDEEVNAVGKFVEDRELVELLLHNDSDLGTISAAIPKENHAAVKALHDAVPDWRHAGHIALVRRKYGKRDFETEEQEAESRRQALHRVAATKAERRASRDAVAHPLKHHRDAVDSGKHTASKRNGAAPAAAPRYAMRLRESDHVTAEQRAREIGWIGVSNADIDRQTAVCQPAKPPRAAADYLVEKQIPRYESKLKQGSLHGYLVGVDDFEPSIVEHPLDVPLKDCKPTKQRERLASAAALAASVPDAPVVELSNLHLSLSEELIAQQRHLTTTHRGPPPTSHAAGGGPSTMLELMFGSYDISAGNLRSMVRGLTPKTRKYSGALSSMSSADPYFADDRSPAASRNVPHLDLGGSLQSPFGAPPGSGLLLHGDLRFASTSADEKKQRQLKYQRYGISDFKGKVQLIVGTFEDLIYQWASEPENDPKKACSKRTSSSGAQRMVVVVPPAYYHLRRELRSLFVSLGFHEESVEAMTIPAYQQAITDELLDEVPQYVKQFSMEVTPVTVSRVTCAARLFAADVASLFASEKFDIIERIREMTESQGFTFVDAVLMVASGNLMDRSSVSRPLQTFADIKV